MLSIEFWRTGRHRTGFDAAGAARHQRAVKHVLDRVRHRNELMRVALEMQQGLSAGRQDLRVSVFAGEQDLQTDCQPESKQTFNYNCNSGSQYSCDDQYNCNAAIYDCKWFACGDDDTGASFACNGTDFLCGDTFDCNDSFDCNTGHIFWCSTTHDCAGATPNGGDQFTCSASGAFGGDEYEPEPGNKTPGDFICGSTDFDTDNFNCRKEFTCGASDQFQCDGTAIFRCGLNDNSGTFTCDSWPNDGTKGNNFECLSDYKCRGSYCGCQPPGSEFSGPTACCGGTTYTPPKGGGS